MDHVVQDCICKTPSYSTAELNEKLDIWTPAMILRSRFNIKKSWRQLAAETNAVRKVRNEVQKQQKRIQQEWMDILMEKKKYDQWWNNMEKMESNIKERLRLVEDSEILLAEKIYINSISPVPKPNNQTELVVPILDDSAITSIPAEIIHDTSQQENPSSFNDLASKKILDVPTVTLIQPEETINISGKILDEPTGAPIPAEETVNISNTTNISQLSNYSTLYNKNTPAHDGQYIKTPALRGLKIGPFLKPFNKIPGYSYQGAKRPGKRRYSQY